MQNESKSRAEREKLGVFRANKLGDRPRIFFKLPMCIIYSILILGKT